MAEDGAVAINQCNCTPKWNGRADTIDTYIEEVALVWLETANNFRSLLGPRLVQALEIDSDPRNFANRLPRLSPTPTLAVQGLDELDGNGEQPTTLEATVTVKDAQEVPEVVVSRRMQSEYDVPKRNQQSIVGPHGAICLVLAFKQSLGNQLTSDVGVIFITWVEIDATEYLRPFEGLQTLIPGVDLRRQELLPA
jgi:hypothetical protein